MIRFALHKLDNFAWSVRLGIRARRSGVSPIVRMLAPPTSKMPSICVGSEGRETNSSRESSHSGSSALFCQRDSTNRAYQDQKRHKLSPTCVQVVRQTGFFSGAYITEKTRLRLDQIYPEKFKIAFIKAWQFLTR